MHIKKTKRQYKKLIIFSVVVGLFFTVAVSYAIRMSPQTLPLNKNGSADLKQQQRQNAINKQDFLDTQSNKSDKVDSTTETTKLPSPYIDDFKVEIENNQLVVTAKLLNIASGTCVLSVSFGNQIRSLTQSANVIYNSQYSSCAGFSINRSDLIEGNWDFNLRILQNGKTISEKMLVFEVT